MLLWCLPPSFCSIWHCSGSNNNWRLSRWPPWQPSWIRLMEMSKMWKVTDGHTHEGWTMVNSPWFKLTWSKAQDELTIDLQDDGSHCGYCNKTFLAILNLHASHQVLVQSDLPFGSRWGLKIFKLATLGAISDNIRRMILAILNLYVVLMPPIKFGLNPDYGLGEDVIWRISRWPPWWPAWMSEWNKFRSSESPCFLDAFYQI